MRLFAVLFGWGVGSVLVLMVNVETANELIARFGHWVVPASWLGWMWLSIQVIALADDEESRAPIYLWEWLFLPSLALRYAPDIFGFGQIRTPVENFRRFRKGKTPETSSSGADHVSGNQRISQRGRRSRKNSFSGGTSNP